MKKSVFFILFTVLVAFTLQACSLGGNPQGVSSSEASKAADIADNFLKDKKDKDLLKVCQDFYFIRYDQSDFNRRSILSAQDISQTGMYIFFTSTSDAEHYLNPEDKSYHYPVNDIQNYIDAYFDGFTFKPSEVKYPGYDEKTNEFVVTALSSPNTGFPELISKKAIGKDMVEIKVNYFDRYNDPKSKDIIDSFTITIKVSNKGYKFISSIQGASSSEATKAVEDTPAEKFIKNTSGKQLDKIIIQIDSALESHHAFSTVKELSSEDLLNFFMSNNDSDSDSWYNKRDEQYHYPVKKITAYLDQYFEGYSFAPHTVFPENNIYNQKENSIVLSSCAVWDFVLDGEIEDIRAVSNNNVEIDTAYYSPDPDPNDPDSTKVRFKMRLTLKIVDGGYRFVSYVMR